MYHEESNSNIDHREVHRAVGMKDYLSLDARYGIWAARISDGKTLRVGDAYPSELECRGIIREATQRIVELDERRAELELFVELAGGAP
jgi:hypothetical protein